MSEALDCTYGHTTLHNRYRNLARRLHIWYSRNNQCLTIDKQVGGFQTDTTVPNSSIM